MNTITSIVRKTDGRPAGIASPSRSCPGEGKKELLNKIKKMLPQSTIAVSNLRTAAAASVVPGVCVGEGSSPRGVWGGGNT